jgi:dihydrofolate reductase
MGKVIASITTSVDGYVTGPDDGPEYGLGRGGERLHYWVMGGPWTYQGGHDFAMHGPDKEFYDELVSTVASGVVGRGMYDAAGAWGGTNPFPGPLFVLTHRTADQPAAETGFRFVADLDAALALAAEAAGDGDIAVGGGADVIRQALAAGKVDELVISTAPVILGGASDCSAGSTGTWTSRWPRSTARRTPPTCATRSRSSRSHGRHAPAGHAADCVTAGRADAAAARPELPHIGRQDQPDASSPRLGAASTSTSGSGQRRPQGNQPCRTPPEADPEAHHRYITLSDWEGQGERSPSRRSGRFGRGGVLRSRPLVTGDSGRHPIGPSRCPSVVLGGSRRDPGEGVAAGLVTLALAARDQRLRNRPAAALS